MPEFIRDVEIELDTLLNPMRDAKTKLQTFLASIDPNDPREGHLDEIHGKLNKKLNELDGLRAQNKLSGESLQREYNALAAEGIFEEIRQLE